MKKLDLEGLKGLIKETLEPKQKKEDSMPASLKSIVSLLKKYRFNYLQMDLETRSLTHTTKGEELSKILKKIDDLAEKAMDIAQPIKTTKVKK